MARERGQVLAEQEDDDEEFHTRVVRRGLSAGFGTALENEVMRMEFPSGKRATFDEHGLVEELDDDHPVEYWVCCRFNEPWTWQLMGNQHVGECVKCRAEVIYRVSAITPTDPKVKKICRHCAEVLASEQASE